MTEFCSAISETEYLDFLHTFPHYHVLQTPMWAQVKDSWENSVCGMYRNGTLVAAALLLFRRLPLGQTLIYSPRGFTLDYTDEPLLREFTQEIVRFARTRKAYLVRIDPEILLSERQNDRTVTFPEGSAAIRRLEAVGFRHMGYEKDFGSYTQPRFHSEFPLRDSAGQPRSDADILAGFDARMRRQIGRYNQTRGVYFTQNFSPEAIEIFGDIECQTAKRHQIHLRDTDYFRKIKQAFGNDCSCFFANLDLTRFEDFIQQQLQIQEQKEPFLRDLEKIRQLKSQGSTILPLAGILTVKSNDTAYVLYGGFDDRLFPRLSVNYQLRYEAIRAYRDAGLSTVSFMGIHGDLNDPLASFKLKFHPKIREYAGEFEYPVRPFLYRIFQKLFPLLRKLYLKLKK